MLTTGNIIKIGKIKKTSKFDIPFFVCDNSKIKKNTNGCQKKYRSYVIKMFINGLIKIKR